MKLIETNEGLLLKFACQSCSQSLEVQAEPCLFECPSCSQGYKLRLEGGEICVKAVSKKSPKVKRPAQKPSPKMNNDSKRKMRVSSSDASRAGSSRKHLKKSSATQLIASFFITFTFLGAGFMWWKSLETQESYSIETSQSQELPTESPKAVTKSVSVSPSVSPALASKSISVTPVVSPVPVSKSFSDTPVEMPSPASSRIPVASSHASFAHVKGIFEENCVSCHGAQRQKGRFRMDTLAGVLKGGSSGKPALIKGNAENSLLYKLISLHADDEDLMPSDGDSLTPAQQTIVRNWINAGAPWEGTLKAKEKAKEVTYTLRDSPFNNKKRVDLSEPKNQALASLYIDSLIDKQLKANGQVPGLVVSDETFLRRAYLDIAGRIPTLAEYDTHLSSNKLDRHALIDELMGSPGFISHSHNYWLDALRVKERVAKNTLETYNNWIQQSIKENMPFDKFAYKLVASEGAYGDPENASVGYYLRDDLTGFMAEDSLSNTMQLFLATDILCAQCHDHPYKKWTQKDFYKLLAFTNGTNVNGRAHNHRETKEMVKILKPSSTPRKNGLIGYYKTIQAGVFKGGSGSIKLPVDYQYDDGKPNELIYAQVPFGEPVKIDYSETQPNRNYNDVNLAMKGGNDDFRGRMHLAKWMTSPENPMFTKTIVNRLWDRVFGSPLVGNKLDMKESDMGDNPALTQFLIDLMKVAGYDQKVFMTILFKTKSYERTALDLVDGKFYNPAPAVRRLTAEQIWDSLLAIRSKNPDLGVGEGKYTKYNLIYKEMVNMSPKKRIDFMLNRDNRLKEASKKYDALPKVALSSKSHRASMMRPGRASFLNIYGMSERGLIDGSIQEATIPQALHLMNNDSYIATKKDGRSTSYLYDRLSQKSGVNTEMRIRYIYNAILTRNPSDSEIRLAKQHLVTSKGLDEEALAWALTNSHEFKIKR